MEIYLLRHGQTDGNVNKTYSGWTDSKLTELGKQQAVDAHLRFEDVSFDVVYSSSLSRALDTARVFTDKEIIVEDDLREMHFGLMEGMTYEEILDKYPDHAKQWQETTANYTFPEGESLRSFYDRVVETYDQIIKKHDVDKLLIVAHSGVIRSIIAHEISESFDGYWKYMVDNCKVAVIEHSDKYKYLKALNI